MTASISKYTGFWAVACLSLVAAVANAGHYGAKKGNDIVDTAVAAGQFNTLAAALEAADLVDTLKGDGPFTVFAPTDAAFAKLPDGTIAELLKPENRDQLTAILTASVHTARRRTRPNRTWITLKFPVPRSLYPARCCCASGRACSFESGSDPLGRFSPTCPALLRASNRRPTLEPARRGLRSASGGQR